MPIVPNATTAAEFSQGNGFNDLLRRLFFPGLPPTECINGYVFFPWGTGPTFPIFCDRDTTVLSFPAGTGTQFVTKPGSAFVTAVAELAKVSYAEAEAAVARAAGVAPDALRGLTVREVGRRVFDTTLPKTQVTYSNKTPAATVGEYFQSLAKMNRDIDDAGALRDLSRQTGLSTADIERLPLEKLGEYLDAPSSGPGMMAARSNGTTVCVSGNGQIGCSVVTGWLEGAIWGGFIGGAIGGGLGAAIGAVIGGIIGWLFD